MRSKALCIVLGMTVLALFAASSSLAAEPIKVGAVLEVTGGLSFLGEPAKNTLMMIQKEVNDAGGINGHPLDLIIYDTEGKPVIVGADVVPAAGVRSVTVRHLPVGGAGRA